MNRTPPQLALHTSPDPLVGPSLESVLEACELARKLEDWDRAADLGNLARIEEVRDSFRQRLRAARAPERGGRA